MNEIVTVLTGGTGSERHVALAGAAQVVAALRRKKYTVFVVDTASGLIPQDREDSVLGGTLSRQAPGTEELAVLRKNEPGLSLMKIPEVKKADLLFFVLHGTDGESGHVQAVAERAHLLYAGTGVLGSAIALDKEISKRLMASAGVPTPDFAIWPATDAEVEALNFPLIVKPANGGSTVGLSLVKRKADLDAAVKLALEQDNLVLLERFIPGREFTVGVLGDRALGVGEIISAREIFDYECKYTQGMAREVFPADISPALTEKIQTLALRVHQTLRLRDFSRVDFRLSSDLVPYCLEANTLPGFTRTSLLPQSALVAGIDFDELCDCICKLAFQRARNR